MDLTALDLAFLCLPFAIVLGVFWLQRGILKSVANYLAAGRCAGRYLIATAAGETAAGVVLLVTTLEVFSRVGFAHNFWGSLAGILTMLMPLIGFVVYRYRQTRSLTFHQFFEVRYSRGIRVYSSFVNVFAGLFSFGIQPAIGARFIVYFLGLPPELVLAEGLAIPTFVPIMVSLVGFALWMAMVGGQITVMVTDFFEGVLAMLLYLVVALAVVSMISIDQVRDVLAMGAPGQSYVNPFDITEHKDFDGWYLLLSITWGIYIYRGYAWQQGFASAARNAHEAKMGGLLAGWRGYGGMAMIGIVSVAAFTVLKHPDFAGTREVVDAGLAGIDNEQLRKQMSMPMALGAFLPPGVKGALTTIAVFGFLVSMSQQLLNFGSTFMQDVVLPLRRQALDPRRHVRWLRASSLGIAAFSCVFSIVYTPVEYLVMLTRLIGALYLGGIGALVWGGLYWSRGTNAGAWTAMLTGSILSVLFNLLQQFWKPLAAWLRDVSGPGPFREFLVRNAERCPLNGLELAFIAAGLALAGYVVVSLVTCREPHDMDKLLHRGKYAVAGDETKEDQRFHWTNIVGIDANMTRGDRLLTWMTFLWGAGWKTFSVSVLTWTLLVGFLPDSWWINYSLVTSLWMPLVLGVITTIWFTWGGARDLRALFRDLRARRDVDTSDDGQVHEPGHQPLLRKNRWTS